MKGGGFRKWYGNQDYVVNWRNGGLELDSFDRSVIRNAQYYFGEGVTWSDLSSKGFAVRYLPPGFLFDVKGSSGFPSPEQLLTVLAVMNSPWTGFAVALLNPTVSFQVGDISRVPFRQPGAGRRERLEGLTLSLVRVRQWEAKRDEISFEFVVPPRWESGLQDMTTAEARLTTLESRVDDEIYDLYGVSYLERAAIEAELAGEPVPTGEDEAAAILNPDDYEIEPPIGRQELAARWISYAVGIVLGRFHPGTVRALGCGMYRLDDFVVGSLPRPDETEFDELVGARERFAYVDKEDGRHVFPAGIESALRKLRVDNGITVLDKDHPRDLPTLVGEALRLMLDRHASEEVITEGAGGDLRRFLSKKYFTDWHFKWYSVSRRKAAVYWPLQSENLSYGFVLFHEKIEETTLYVLQRDYLDVKINGLRQRIGDLTARQKDLEGSARKHIARQIQELNETLEEIETFAKTMGRIVREGYEPQPNWIDDGVILRMAPLWELIPIWKKYPKKYWKRLQEGEYDWSHIAMNYWPDRVREACRENRSYAIAHGHPEWYQGD
jgi:hypothetical protein